MLAFASLSFLLVYFRGVVTDIEGQVLGVQRDFLEAIENRDWGDVEERIAPAYADRWELDAQGVGKVVTWLRRQFLFLEIIPGDSPRMVVSHSELGRDRVARVMLRQVLRIEGRGGPYCDQIMARANAVAGPFDFHWERKGRWPQAWQLVQIDHPSLNVSAQEIANVLDWEESY